MPASEHLTKHLQEKAFGIQDAAVLIYENDELKEDCFKLQAVLIYLVTKVYHTAWEDCCREKGVLK